MKYNFDKVINRRNTSSMKWDVKENELPMWVADMDFQTAPAVIETLKNKINFGIFGYSLVSKEWQRAICAWWQKRHGFSIEKDWLIFCTGVIPALSCAVKRLTNVGDNVLVQTPVYNMFFNSIVNHGRHALENRLMYDGNEYSIDFEDLEKKLSHPLTTLMILCNPHNPIGKIWDKETLKRIGELCEKNHVVVVSDEIHCDVTDPGTEYVPFASVSDVCTQNSVTCISASKAFNLAGMQSAAVIIPDEALRYKMERGLNSDELAEPNAFAIDAVTAALTQGEEWLDELRFYLKDNKDLASDFLKNEIPEVKLITSQATYLLWIDCQNLTDDAEAFCEFIREETGLYLSAGSEFKGNGNLFVRMNIACPKKLVEDGLNRFKMGVQAYMRLNKS